jgi:hypothetical protein
VRGAPSEAIGQGPWPVPAQATRVTLPLTKTGPPGRDFESLRGDDRGAGATALCGAGLAVSARKPRARAGGRVDPKPFSRNALTQNAERAGSRRRPLTGGYSGSEFLK